MIKHGNMLFPGEKVSVMRDGAKVASAELATLVEVHEGQATLQWADGRQEQVPIDRVVPTTHND